MRLASRKYPFGTDDFFQQVLGSAIITSPLLFTEEVWNIAYNMHLIQAAILFSVSLVMGHGILYVAEREREWNLERKLLGLTIRYISLMIVSIGTIVTVLGLTSAAETFNAGALQTVKLVALLSIFAVTGAATADNLI